MKRKNPEGETYGFFSVVDMDGRVSSLEWSDKHPYHLRVVGVLPHGSEIRPKTIRDAQKIGEWFSEQASRWGPFAENPPVGSPIDVVAMVNPHSGTAHYDLLQYGREIIEERGDKALWIAGDLIASGDEEDLPNTSEPWEEVSVTEAWEEVGEASGDEYDND